MRGDIRWKRRERREGRWESVARSPGTSHERARSLQGTLAASLGQLSHSQVLLLGIHHHHPHRLHPTEAGQFAILLVPASQLGGWSWREETILAAILSGSTTWTLFVH